MTIRMKRTKVEISNRCALLDLKRTLTENPILIDACFLASELKFRSWENQSSIFKSTVSSFFDKRSLEYRVDPECFFRQCIIRLIDLIPNIVKAFQKEALFPQEEKRKECMVEIIIPFFGKMFEGESGPEALISSAVNFLKPVSLQNYSQRVSEYISLFILHGPYEKVSDNLMLNCFAEEYYEDYIVRLPSDDLIEFLTCPIEKARIKAANKIKAELV